MILLINWHAISGAPKSKKCSTCHMEFPDRNSLQTHRRHVHKKPRKCNICNKVFMSYTGLKRHKLTTHEGQKNHSVILYEENSCNQIRQTAIFPWKWSSIKITRKCFAFSRKIPAFATIVPMQWYVCMFMNFSSNWHQFSSIILHWSMEIGNERNQ